MSPTYRFGRFVLIPATRQLLADGGAVTLGARAFDVLLALVEKRERLVSKDELLKLAWPGLVVGEGNLQVQISALRKILGTQAIVTVPGRGYRFALELDADAPPAERLPDSGESKRMPKPLQEHSRTEASGPIAMSSSQVAGHLVRSGRWIAAAVAAVVLLAVAGVWYSTQHPSIPAPPPTAAESSAPDAKSIAVLPFADMSESRNMAYFADGVQDDLLTQLALLGELKVVSRTSVAEYRNSGKNIRQIASELGVASLVEGSVRRAGDRARVSAQLIDARTDRHLWAQTYDRDLKDIFAIQSELATEIARALKGSLNPAEEKRLARKPTESLAAYDLYQRYQELERRSMAVWAQEKLDERIGLLERVVELDPKFSLAWAQLATLHGQKYFWGLDRTETRVAKARQAVDRAIALAPDDLTVKAAIGNFYYYGLQDFARAAAYFEDLLRAAPNNVAILTQLSWVKRRLGRWPEANALLDRALAIDPRNADALKTLRENMAGLRHLDAAIALQRRLAQIQPDNIDEQAKIHDLEWTKSGSPAAYVAWRKTLPEKVARESFWVWFLDLRRALKENDPGTAMHLMETPPKSWEAWFAKTWRAVLLLAKGDRAHAHELARALLRKSDAVLKNDPNESIARWSAMLSHAVLGERQAAWDLYKHSHASSVAIPDALDIDGRGIDLVTLYAVLGDDDGAFRALEQVLKQRGFYFSGGASPELYLFAVRDDPRIQTLLNDPTKNAPLPIVNWDLQKMLAELRAPDER